LENQFFKPTPLGLTQASPGSAIFRDFLAFVLTLRICPWVSPVPILYSPVKKGFIKQILRKKLGKITAP